MSSAIRVAILGVFLLASSTAQAKKPGKAAALKAARAFAAELHKQEEAGDERRDAKSVDRLAALTSKDGFSVLVGYESNSDGDDESSPGGGNCSATTTDRKMVGWTFDCLRQNSVGFAPSSDQWSEWSKKAMAEWTWQIDASGLARLSKTARLLVLNAPETLFVFAMVTDDDGVTRVAAVYSGMTYNE